MTGSSRYEYRFLDPQAKSTGEKVESMYKHVKRINIKLFIHNHCTLPLSSSPNLILYLILQPRPNSPNNRINTLPHHPNHSLTPLQGFHQRPQNIFITTQSQCRRRSSSTLTATTVIRKLAGYVIPHTRVDYEDVCR